MSVHVVVRKSCLHSPGFGNEFLLVVLRLFQTEVGGDIPEIVIQGS